MIIIACFCAISATISGKISEKIVINNLIQKFKTIESYESLVRFLDNQIEIDSKSNYRSVLEKYKIGSKRNYHGSLTYKVDYKSIMGKPFVEFGILKLTSFDSVLMMSTLVLQRAKVSKKFTNCKMKKETFGNSESNYVVISMNRKKSQDNQ